MNVTVASSPGKVVEGCERAMGRGPDQLVRMQVRMTSRKKTGGSQCPPAFGGGVEFVALEQGLVEDAGVHLQQSKEHE